MASSLALKRLVSSNILPSSLRVAIAPSISRLFNTNAATPDDHDDRRRADGFFPDLQGRRQGAKKDMFDPLSPTRSLNMMDQVKGNRFLSTSRDIPGLGSEAKESNLRPLSPHLPIYKPQLTSTFPISHRISGAFLATILLFFYLLCLKIGLICFTYTNFYQFFFYSSKLLLISVSIAALALSYYLYNGVRHLLTDFSGKLR
ncbi:succinate dehydrogenase subunit 3-1, mitochondrial [Gossypium raimondii]|uniref:succinate dehydrogenase subunit 3-1, mitochondrial n=1 Tax=Gossypium raimondii TaxID=29730 RepID=UPI00227CB8B6|nr:succinate dehydrogenase subunit 3-1, mitochondrial [Gossypium raimondii]